MQEIVLELVRQLPATLAALAGLLLAYKGLSDKLDAYHHAVNGQMDKLLAATETAGKQEGRDNLLSEQEKASP